MKEEAKSDKLQGDESIHEVKAVDGMYENYFLEYASYVILERAVPAMEDGLKPVQRRILHAMKEMDDGRFNKVANIIGSSMQYHPHGDAAIGDAIVNLGQKELLIETQGNWGDMRTGDSAAAPRYIEARLSKFALEVAFNAQTTVWQSSYDGRKREPVTLPMKFPLLLAQGVDGIAVGLATKIMPHNFIELINASIDILRKRSVNLMPDFPTGGMADFSNYNEGKRGGKVRVRAKIEELDKRTLLIKDIPYGTTTTSLMESIVKANDIGKIKIKKVVDNTARDVEIEIQLHPGTSPDITIDALYAFTECEASISPNACLIIDDKPVFMGVNDILKVNTRNTVDLLKRELEIRLGELDDKWHFSSLEKIFIEKRIYHRIEEAETWEEVIAEIDKGLRPYKKLFRRVITEEDIVRLTEIKIKRISKFDGFKANEQIKALENEIKEVKNNLANLVDYAVAYFRNLLKKYGAGKERKTEIKNFEIIKASAVAVANQKLYVNRDEGFIGYSLKKDEYISECSDMDDIIVFRRDGKCLVTRVSEKSFVGKDIIHVAVWKKNDERMIYNMAYVDGKTGVSKVKRFAVTAITRDKEYDLTSGNPRSKVLYFSANPNSESEIVNIMLSNASGARNKIFDFDFAELEIKGRASQGNILTKYAIKQIKFKEKGASTLGGRDIWYDENLGRLNVDERGKYLGSFEMDDTILVITDDGNYEITNFELTNRYDAERVRVIEKFRPAAIVSAIHYDMVHKSTYIKRFLIETTTQGKKFSFISEGRNSKLLLVTTQIRPVVEVASGKKTNKKITKLDLNDFIEVRGWKAIGNKLNEDPIHDIKLISEDELPDIMAIEHPELIDEDYDVEDMKLVVKKAPVKAAAATKPKTSVAAHPKKVNIPKSKKGKGGKGGGQMRMF